MKEPELLTPFTILTNRDVSREAIPLFMNSPHDLVKKIIEGAETDGLRI